MALVVDVIDNTPGFTLVGGDRDFYHKSVVFANKGLDMEVVGRGFTIYKTMDVSGNKFEGGIPESIGLLKELIILNMSNNAFTGHIPPSLLEGPIPKATQIQSQNISSFAENPGLCGPPLLKKCGGVEHDEDDEEKEEKDQVLSWIAAAVGYVPGLFCGLTIAYIFT
ncbi:PREDICTED: receptor like protein 30-like [Camelina sativa]|uniref:Receptor like protein 30-like n=1 Tax=Camelina sativa TaxID=90675 RepID=A0ABM1QQX7_CAMSA|nr:PREDICTED: receptor like protein 30-like [Camelina sativa]